jgi:hypothetical protein
MTKYRKKPVVIDAISFDEFVAIYKNVEKNINENPSKFEYNGHLITKQSDEIYLIPTLEGTYQFTTDDMLITGIKGEIYPCKIDVFVDTYELAE